MLELIPLKVHPYMLVFVSIPICYGTKAVLVIHCITNFYTFFGWANVFV